MAPRVLAPDALPAGGKQHSSTLSFYLSRRFLSIPGSSSRLLSGPGAWPVRTLSVAISEAKRNYGLGNAQGSLLQCHNANDTNLLEARVEGTAIVYRYSTAALLLVICICASMMADAGSRRLVFSETAWFHASRRDRLTGHLGGLSRPRVSSLATIRPPGREKSAKPTDFGGELTSGSGHNSSATVVNSVARLDPSPEDLSPETARLTDRMARSEMVQNPLS